MKIGMFTDSYLPSHDGVATSVDSMSRSLRKLGHQVYIVAPHHPDYKDTSRVYRVYSVQLLREPNIRIGLEIPQQTLFEISQIDFDIIHGHSGGAISFIGWQIAQLRKIPFIETYHTMWKHYRHYFIFPQLFKANTLKKVSALFGNLSDAFIAPTEKVKRELRSYGITKPIYIVPSGIDREKFLNQKKGYVHHKLKLSSNTKILLTVGRLEPEKSIDFLIKSFAQIYQRASNTVLVIIGEGRDLPKLKSLAAKHGIQEYTHFIGTLKYSQMARAYADADIFVFASRTETQGLVIIEALTAGVPVVTVQDSSYKDIITSGYNGYQVKKDEADFADKVIKMLDDHHLHRTLSRNATKSTQKYSSMNTTKNLENVYQQLIEDWSEKNASKTFK